ncbi:hypothetical protein ACSMX9_25950 [Streptomyces sp. LE64]|jgi:hypothetical protein|uniref:hypothetical protein n=1 Tax=unclassified Streptomyces TaxID=2593676 RepID=UPI003334282B
MPTSVPTDRERDAVQAYLRLLHTVRAALDTSPPAPAHPALVPEGVLDEAERALAGAGLAGNEEEFFALLRGACAFDR